MYNLPNKKLILLNENSKWMWQMSYTIIIYMKESIIA